MLSITTSCLHRWWSTNRCYQLRFQIIETKKLRQAGTNNNSRKNKSNRQFRRINISGAGWRERDLGHQTVPMWWANEEYVSAGWTAAITYTWWKRAFNARGISFPAQKFKRGVYSGVRCNGPKNLPFYFLCRLKSPRCLCFLSAQNAQPQH